MVRDPYRARLPVGPDPYLVAWSTLHRRRVAMAALAIGLVWIAGPSCAIAIAANSGGAIALGVVFAGAIACGIAFLAPQLACPRCVRPFFHAPTLQFGAVLRHCSHCGLAIGTRKKIP